MRASKDLRWRILGILLLCTAIFFQISGQSQDPNRDLLISSDTSIVRTSERLAEFSVFYTLNSDSANFKHAQKMLEDAVSDNNAQAIAKAHVYLGQLNLVTARFDDALEHLYTAYNIYNNSGDKVGESSTLTFIGNVYLRLFEHQAALEVFSNALEMYRALNDSVGIQIGITDLGVYFQRIGNFQRAIDLFRESLTMADQVGNLHEEGIILGNLGSTNRQIGNFEQSIYYLKRALEVKRKSKSGRSIAHTLNDITETYYAMGDYDNALHYAHQTIEFSRENGYNAQWSYASLQLSRILEKLGSYPAALDAYKQHKVLYDSIINDQKNRVINDLRIKYESAEKEREIEELSARNAEIERRRNLILFIAGIVSLLALISVYVLRLRRQRDRALLARTKELEEARSRFFANISHEFRTPLTLILGHLDFIGSGKHENIEQHVKPVERNAKRLQMMIDQILDLSRADHNVLRLKVSSIDLKDFLENVCQSFLSLAEQNRIHFVVDIEWNGKQIYADPDRLQSIVYNLISNAFKFTPEGGEVRVSAIADSSDPGSVSIQVSDTGLGIPEDEIQYIFNRYYTRDQQMTSSTKGVGIGLSLSKSLVDLHDGQISVSSEQGKGSVFTVVLPVGKEHFMGRENVIFAESDESSMEMYRNPHLDMQVHQEWETALEVEGESHLALIVEDNPEMRRFLRSILKGSYRLLEASSGEEGLELTCSKVPDIIVSDVMMPGMDGFEFCKRVRGEILTCHIPLILLTAKASDEDRLEGLGSEADMYLSKPFIPRELLLRMRNLLEARKRQQSYFTRQSVLKPAEIEVDSVESQFLKKLSVQLESKHDDNGFSVDQLAKGLNMSRTQLHRKLKALTGKSATDIIRGFRLERAYELLQAKAGSISEIAYQVGFRSPSYFVKCFRDEYGKTPGQIA